MIIVPSTYSIYLLYFKQILCLLTKCNSFVWTILNSSNLMPCLAKLFKWLHELQINMISPVSGPISMHWTLSDWPSLILMSCHGNTRSCYINCHQKLSKTNASIYVFLLIVLTKKKWEGSRHLSSSIDQRWKKVAAAAERCLPFFVQFLACLLIWHDFLHFFAHILCANFSGSKFASAIL